MNRKITVFLGRDDAELRRQTRKIAPEIEILGPDDLENHPERIAEIEIAYEGLKPEQLTSANGLKWLQNGGAGVNHLPLDDLKTRGVIVTNVSGIHARCITEHLFGLLLMHTRQLDQARRQQKKREWHQLGGATLSLYGKTLGILGAGEIGAQIARVGRAFEMKIVGLNRSGQATPQIETMFSPATRREFFAQCDIVMNVLPLTDATRDLMDNAAFDALPSGAIVLNAGRGATIDTSALIRALKSGKLRAAMLDVTEPEPLPENHPLWTMPNVFITPHYAGVHPEYDAEADAIFLYNLHRYVAGEELQHRVGEAGY